MSYCDHFSFTVIILNTLNTDYTIVPIHKCLRQKNIKNNNVFQYKGCQSKCEMIRLFLDRIFKLPLQKIILKVLGLRERLTVAQQSAIGGITSLIPICCEYRFDSSLKLNVNLTDNCPDKGCQ